MQKLILLVVILFTLPTASADWFTRGFGYFVNDSAHSVLGSIQIYEGHELARPFVVLAFQFTPTANPSTARHIEWLQRRAAAHGYTFEPQERTVRLLLWSRMEEYPHLEHVINSIHEYVEEIPDPIRIEILQTIVFFLERPQNVQDTPSTHFLTQAAPAAALPVTVPVEAYHEAVQNFLTVNNPVQIPAQVPAQIPNRPVIFQSSRRRNVVTMAQREAAQAHTQAAAQAVAAVRAQNAEDEAPRVGQPRAPIVSLRPVQSRAATEAQSAGQPPAPARESGEVPVQAVPAASIGALPLVAVAVQTVSLTEAQGAISSERARLEEYAVQLGYPPHINPFDEQQVLAWQQSLEGQQIYEERIVQPQINRFHDEEVESKQPQQDMSVRLQRSHYQKEIFPSAEQMGELCAICCKTMRQIVKANRRITRAEDRIKIVLTKKCNQIICGPCLEHSIQIKVGCPFCVTPACTDGQPRRAPLPAVPRFDSAGSRPAADDEL